MINLATTQFDSPENGGPGVLFYIAQHMPNVMRKEVRNIGVFVQKGDSFAARFYGEAEDGELDGRKLRSLPDPRIYRMWVRYWRRQAATIRNDDIGQHLVSQSKETFKFIPGGHVTDTGVDTVDEIATYLYAMLVSEGGLKEALSFDAVAIDGGDETGDVRADLRNEFRKLDIMSSANRAGLNHPIYEDVALKGASQWQFVSFVQQSDSETVAIEPLTITPRMRKRARERAGYLAYLFDDLVKGSNGKKVNPYAVIRVNEEDREKDEVKYALDVVNSHAKVIEWSDQRSLSHFLNERESIALSR